MASRPLGMSLDGGRLLTLGAAVVLLVPLSSAGNLAHVPIVLPFALALLVALSVWRPGAGLILLSALIPVSGWMAQATGLHGLRMTEAVVLAVLTGALAGLAIRSRRSAADDSAFPAGVWPAAFLLAATATSSAVVEWCVSQAGGPMSLSAVADFFGPLATTYLYGTAAQPAGLAAAARLVEGVGLVLLILEFSRRHPDLPCRLAIASLAGAAGAAIINFSVMAAAADPPTVNLVSYLGGAHRLAGHVGDVNATGSYFLMMTLTGIGFTVRARGAVLRGCALTIVAGVAAAFWLAGSRAAVAAALLVVLGGTATWIRRRQTRQYRRTLLAGVVLASLALPIVIASTYPGRDVGDGALASARIRVEFVATSLRMWSTEPVFGVGAGRYYSLSDRFMGPFIKRLWRENAHNNFLQIGAELGAVGLAGFVWLLVAAGRRVREALRTRADSARPLLIGASAGAAAYLVTCLSGHPLLVPETAYPFWIVGGFAVALAHRRPGSASSTRMRRCSVAGAIGLCLLATVPFRVDAVVRDAALRQDARFGAFDWELDPADGRRYRWIGPRASFFVTGRERAVSVPLRALHASLERPVTVDVAVGKQPMARVPLFHDDWVHLPMDLPASGGWKGIHRLDLTVDRPWPPDERRNGDGRTLGVQVGEIVVAASGHE
ncbi:MAG: O-antigen ligase family protein [Acidobacteria bacterium]|nr:O-antigen ligase family protein [Acidobacteriota bacterium]